MCAHYHHHHSYHHYTSYYGSASFGFQCGICGRFSRAQQRVPQCGVCMTPLCTACNRFGFCAKHFEILTPAEQTQARDTFLKMKRAQYWFIGGMIIGMIIFMVGIPVGVTSSIHGSYTNIFGWVFIPFAAFIGILIGGSIYFQLTTKRGWATFQAIGQKYRTGQEVPMGAPPFPAIGSQGAYFPPQPTYPPQVTFAQPPAPAPQQPLVQSPPPVVPSPQPLEDAQSKKPEVRFCPYCGSNLSPAAQFCSNCGSTVK